MKTKDPLKVKCPVCKQLREPEYNETSRRHVCPVCTAPLDSQVWIEQKKRGSAPKHPWRKRRDS